LIARAPPLAARVTSSKAEIAPLVVIALALVIETNDPVEVIALLAVIELVPAEVISTLPLAVIVRRPMALMPAVVPTVMPTEPEFATMLVPVAISKSEAPLLS
jgi:hypothetical protein